MEQNNNLIDQHARYFIYRKTPSVDTIANTNNQLQERAEGTRLGIPAVLISNPRNHYTTIADISNLEEAEHYYVTAKDEPGQFTIFPDSLGLAASRDLDLVREFSQIARKEWTSSGLRKMYGYNADLATQPLWPRILETFGESPKLVSDINIALIKGFQGEKLDENSVSLTTKHFPGGGSRYLGKDPHFEEGNFNIYPTKGSLQKYHLPPFIAAIEAGTASIYLIMLFQVIKVQSKGLLLIKKTSNLKKSVLFLIKHLSPIYCVRNLVLRDMSIQIREQSLIWHGVLNICREKKELLKHWKLVQIFFPDRKIHSLL